jgi:hypothetical protein
MKMGCQKSRAQAWHDANIYQSLTSLRGQQSIHFEREKRSKKRLLCQYQGRER